MDFIPHHYMVEDVEEDEEEIEQRVVAPKRYMRDMLNPLEHYSDEAFRKRFRFRKDAVVDFILPRISADLQKPSNRGLPVTPLHQLLVALRFYATGSFQTVVGDLAHLSQPTVSRIIARVSDLLALLLMHFVKMPATAAAVAATFNLFAGIMRRRDHPGDSAIPNIVGAIDCTHVRLVSTRFENIAETFRNRKGYFSLNVQAVVGPSMEFVDLVPNWPGSNHDSRIFQNSRLNHNLETRQQAGALLGDAGYRSMPYLFTPFDNPQRPAEMRYNRAQKRGRNIVERVFGVWKRRFPCLSKGLATKLRTSTSIVVVCAVLHNMSLIVNDQWAEEADNVEDDDVPVDRPADNNAPGLAARREIVRLHFQREGDPV